MNLAIACHQLKPIDRVLEFKEAKEAFQYLKSSSHFGKIVIRL